MRSNLLQPLLVPIADILPYEGHARRHSRAQQAKVHRLLADFGQVTPILVDTRNTIVDGHLVWEVMREMGHQTIAVVRAEALSDAEVRTLRLALNRVAADSCWEPARLRAELSALATVSFDLRRTCFDLGEIEVITNAAVHPKRNADSIPEIVQTAVSRTGDLWMMDDHRVLCGDGSTSCDRLMDRHVARMAFADPLRAATPQQISEGSATDFIPGSGADFWSKTFRLLSHHIADGGFAYLCVDFIQMHSLLRAADECEFQAVDLCVWTRQQSRTGKLYRGQHDLIAVFETASRKKDMKPQRPKRGNVWSHRASDLLAATAGHTLEAPTKPVAMIADAIRDVTKRGDGVFDPFLGSAATLIAAHVTKRRCFAFEVRPLYVDLAIRRWQRLTGRKAIHEASKLTYEEIARERCQNDR